MHVKREDLEVERSGMKGSATSATACQKMACIGVSRKLWSDVCGTYGYLHTVKR